MIERITGLLPSRDDGLPDLEAPATDDELFAWVAQLGQGTPGEGGEAPC